MEPGASCQIIILKKGLKNYDENITDSHTGKLYFCQLSDRAKMLYRSPWKSMKPPILRLPY